jgi:ribosomal-protein-alanine acetyltransferase
VAPDIQTNPHEDARDEADFARLGADDAPAVAALEARCFTLPWSEDVLRGAFGQSVFSAFGLKRGEALLAYVSVYHTAGELEILNIAVSPEHRNRGHGKRLLGLVLQLAGKMGIVTSVLEVRPSNVAAIALYSGFGYRQAGRRPAYYPDTGEDALIFTLDVPPTRSLP